MNQARDLKHIVLGAALVTCGLSALAAVNLTSFTPGTPIKSSEVNANFSSLKANIEALQAPGGIAGAQLADGSVTTGKLSVTGTAADGKVLKLQAGNLAWSDDLTGGAGGAAYSAGTGLALSGTTFSVANLGISAGLLADGAVTAGKLGASGAADGKVLKLSGGNLTWSDDLVGSAGSTYNADGSSLQLSGTTFSVKDGGIGSAKLANGSVTSSKLGLPLEITGSRTDKELVSVINTSTGGNGNEVGILGRAGGQASTAGTDGGPVGVWGDTGSGTGVYGSSKGGIGVAGNSDSSYGILGSSISGTGIVGSSGSGYAIYGSSNTSTAINGFSFAGDGVIGQSNSKIGVKGISDSDIGVRGESNSNPGVYGVSVSSVGVNGISTSGIGVVGQSSSGKAAVFQGGSGGAGSCTYNGGAGWTCTSDRNKKEHFRTVNANAILEALMTMPVTRWNMKGDRSRTPHMGPVAQDFSAAFKLGENDTTINTADAQGVALAAIQGLYGVVKQKDAQIKTLSGQVRSLEDRLAALEKRLRAK